MADANSADSPLEAAAEMTGPRATEAFSVLGNETRLAILLALWEAYEPFAADPTNYAKGNEVPFSELRERVGMRDPGQFNYHLDKFPTVAPNWISGDVTGNPDTSGPE